MNQEFISLKLKLLPITLNGQIGKKLLVWCIGLSQRVFSNIKKGYLATPRVVDSGKVIFDCEYLSDFDDKIEKVSAVV